jgi:two-component system cell cycle sensor histidine kinase/response regulator CckA
MKTIFLVEDQVDVRRFTSRLLQQNGYEVIEAENGEAALRAWPNHSARVDLLLTDLSMPGGMSGDLLARQLQAQKPGLPVVYTSGYGAYSGLNEPRLVEGENFIAKPSPKELMLQTIRFALSAGESDANDEADLESSLMLAEGRF